MKKVIILLFSCFMAFESFAQLQIGGGPAYFLNEKFAEHQLSSIDYSLSVGYALKKIDLGFEFVSNNYKTEGYGKDFYGLYQYQLFGKYYPLKRKTWFIKGGANITTELYHYDFHHESWEEVGDEKGVLWGLEGGIGFQDRLVKKLDLFLNVSLTYNYLSMLKADYFYNSDAEVEPFYALKVSLIYQLNFKKKQ